MKADFRDQDRIAYGVEDVTRAVDAVRERTAIQPQLALILGSGLGSFVEGLENRVALDPGEIPGYPDSTVEGHSGTLVLGKTAGVPIVIQSGRLHVYEGYSASTVTFPLRVMRGLGAKVLVVTNVAGGVNDEFEAGDLVFVEDHINFQFRSPLRGSGPIVDEDRFVDLAEPYSRRLLKIARATAGESGLVGHVGTYFAVSGPSYETPAEVQMIRKLGGDMVGMSTVPEVIAARHANMDVLGVTCISNRATGLSPDVLSHDEVIRVAATMEKSLKDLLTRLLPRIADGVPA